MDIKINNYKEEEPEIDEVSSDEETGAVALEERKPRVKEEQKESGLKKFAFLFWVLFLILLIGGIFMLLVYKTSFTFNKMSFGVGENEPGLLPLSQMMPRDDEDRENILLLGYRGEDDPNGGLLTDTLMIASIERSSGRIALISVPRDLYIQIPGTKIYEKINYAYAYGQKDGRNQGILYTKAAISQVTGLYIDNSVLVNFNAFEDLVDALGGITVHLDKPFREDTQFSKEIIIDLPAGGNYMDGQTALYFVRSRYTTSDFDRARRQQQAILAIKDKALSLGVLTNPVKVFNLLDALGKNVKMDLTVGDIRDLVGLYSRLDFDGLKQKVFDTSPQGLLRSATAETGAYILLPVAGDYSEIQKVCQNIFE